MTSVGKQTCRTIRIAYSIAKSYDTLNERDEYIIDDDFVMEILRRAKGGSLVISGRLRHPEPVVKEQSFAEIMEKLGKITTHLSIPGSRFHETASTNNRASLARKSRYSSASSPSASSPLDLGASRQSQTNGELQGFSRRQGSPLKQIRERTPDPLPEHEEEDQSINNKLSPKKTYFGGSPSKSKGSPFKSTPSHVQVSSPANSPSMLSDAAVNRSTIKSAVASPVATRRSPSPMKSIVNSPLLAVNNNRERSPSSVKSPRKPGFSSSLQKIVKTSSSEPTPAGKPVSAIRMKFIAGGAPSKSGPVKPKRSRLNPYSAPCQNNFKSGQCSSSSPTKKFNFGETEKDPSTLSVAERANLFEKSTFSLVPAKKPYTFAQDANVTSPRKKLVLPTPTMAKVPFRRQVISKTVSPRVIRATRKPLKTISKETKMVTPSPVLESEDEALTPVSSRSSSSTSIASSISPIAPIERYQKRLQEEEFVKKEQKPPEIKNDSKVEYQELLTKYFKAKKMIRRLRDQTKYDQRKIALMEFSRQQDAILMQSAENENETTVSEEQHQSTCGIHSEAGCKKDITSTAKNEVVPVILSSSTNCTPTEIPSHDQENNMVVHGAVGNNPSQFPSYFEVRNELISKMAELVSDKSLRPVIFSIPQESPPCKMLNVIEKLSKNRCKSCGRRMNNKWN